MRRQSLSEADLERHLLRRTVSELHADRLRCDRCKRTPLVGEVVYRYAKGRTMCALCRPTRREMPVEALPVRHGEEIRAQRLTPKHRTDA